MDIKDPVCAYPFFHIQIKPNGMYKPCCRFDVDEAHKMQTSPNPFEAFYNGDWIELRSKMVNGVPVKGCDKCFRQEANQGQSMRLNASQSQLEYNHHHPDIKLKFIEVAFGNFCNLKCRSCSGDLSSKWFDDEEVLSKTLDFRSPTSGKKIINSDLLQFLRYEQFSGVEHIKFTGGEPMLHKDFEPFLNFLVEHRLAEKIFLRVCTNASYFPRQSVLDLLAKFKSVEISLSIDGTEEHNDYLRNPSKWSVVKDNALKWISLYDSNPNRIVDLCTTISALSLISLPPLMTWWNEISGSRKVIFQPVFDPVYLSPEILPKDFVKTYSPALPQNVEKMFSGKKFSPQIIDQFFRYNLGLDELRGETLFEIFPEFQKLFSEVRSS